MKTKQKRAQIVLISIGFLLIVLTYFYYPYIKKIKTVENQTTQKDALTATDSDHDTSFENVEYKGLYDLNKNFSIKADKAHILNEEPDVVYMTGMHVILYLDNGRIVNITSKKGTYNKVTHDCYFEENVSATDEETKIFSDNMDLLATENSIKVYNNVIINYPTGSLYADKADYDFETKNFKVSMFDDKSVKIKVFK